MKIKFAKEFEGGAPTGFQEKVLAGIYAKARGFKNKQKVVKWHDQMVKKGIVKPFLNKADKFALYEPKFHTMRSMKTKTKIGDEIKYLITTSKSKHEEFAPKGKVLAVQYIILEKEILDGDNEIRYTIKISNDNETWCPFQESMEQFATNEGFETAKQMFDYFIPEIPSEGDTLGVKQKLIHWTEDLRYTIKEEEDLDPNSVEV